MRRSSALVALALIAVGVLPAPAQANFGIASATASLEASDGVPMLAAGAHPDLTIGVSLNTTIDATTGLPRSDGNPRSIELRLPPGLIGNPRALPTCSRSDLLAESCPPESQVGVAMLTVYTQGSSKMEAPIFNLTPPPGTIGQLALEIFGVPAFVDFDIGNRAKGYPLIAEVSGLSQAVPVGGAELTLWGEPDPEGAPLITNPTECTGAPLAFSARVDSWQQPGVFAEATIDRDPEGDPLVIEDCGELPFEAALRFKPSSPEADSPSGLDLAIVAPQISRPRASALLRDAVVTLPEGMTVNPAAVAGLSACSRAQVNLVGDDPARCPPASQIGTARIVSPLLADPLPAAVYLARQQENELGALLAVYLTVDDPRTGTVLKLIGRVEPNPRTGRLTIAFDGLPQLPFERIELSLPGGERALLTTPSACGRLTASASFAPWSGTVPVTAADSFEATTGPNGSACPDNRFAPRLQAGVTNPRAGAYSPFVLRLLRPPATQALGGIDLRLPRGLLARLAGTAYCPEAALAAIPSALGSGAAQMTAPACPVASRVGSVAALTGAGAFPFPLETGGAYLAGPYRGAPLSLALTVPAVAGPFDLGNAVVRVALEVDRGSAQIRAISDSLPTILHGIPLQLRELRVLLDRDRFMRNPTSCARKRIEAAVVSAAGAGAQLREPFQVAGCRRLGFAPRLGLKLQGDSDRGGHPTLKARLRARGDEGGIRRVAVTLPPSLRLAQEHIRTICTRVSWAEDNCPKSSVYGRAEVQTPLLDRPLRGPVHLRSSDGKLPDLVARLGGQIELDLVGRIDSTQGGLRVTFAHLPDAPVRRLSLRMRGGGNGLLVNGVDLCGEPRRAMVRMDGQNGRVHDRRTSLRIACSER